MKKELIITGIMLVLALVSSLEMASAQKDASTVFYLTQMKAGEVRELRMNDPVLNKIILTSRRNYIGDVEIRIGRVQPSGEFTVFPKAYTYFEIRDVNFRPTRFTNITVNFRVTREWLLKNQVNRFDIALYRFDNGTWSELPTAITRSETRNDYRYYSAETPGFGYFAIAEKGQAPIVNFLQRETPRPEENETLADPEELLGYEGEPEENDTEPSFLETAIGPDWWKDTLLQVLLAIGVIILFYVLSRREA